MRPLLRGLGAGRLLYLLVHRPIARLRQSLRYGGPIAEHVMERHRRAMVEAAGRLGPLPLGESRYGPVYLMTGRRFWYQTVFCLHSLARTSGCEVHAELIDDGSLDAECRGRLGELGPTVTVHSYPELLARLESKLPRADFPHLRERWDNYPNIRKLVDVHLLDGPAWKLVLDSDLLFFRRPNALLRWCAAPDRILHAVDCHESYGYTRPLLEELAGAPIPPLVNVGICGLRSTDLDWSQLERWIAELHRRERTSYYLEQALVAMLTATRKAEAVPASDYITGPSRAQTEVPSAVMHHYVDTSKRWYYQFGWRHLATPSPGQSREPQL